MNAAKRKSVSGSVVAGLTRLLSGGGRGVAIGVGLVGLLLLGAVLAWRRWGDEILNDPRYTLSAQQIEITPQPDWIQTDVKADVVRDSGLGQMNVGRDEGLASRIADAFSLHSWVAKVDRVHLYPKRVTVDLQYRRPVAMVEVSNDGQRGLLPVDTQGYLLPPDDFSASQARDYLRVTAGEVRPAGPVGTPWGDERIVGAARIADVLSDQWRNLDLYRIVATDVFSQRRRRATVSYRLVTRNGTHVLWGSAPGKESSGEANASQKVARLIQYNQQHGPLDDLGGSAEIDLRDQHNLSITPRTAVLPGSPSQ